MGEYLTMKDAARRLRVVPLTVRRWIRDGRLPGYRLGPRLLRVRADEVDALARRIGDGAPAEG